MNERQQRGLVIAATQKLVQKGKVWLVPSQTGNGKKHTVCPDPDCPFCGFAHKLLETARWRRGVAA